MPDIQKTALEISRAYGYNLPPEISVIILSKVIEWTILIVKHECPKLQVEKVKDNNAADSIILKWFIRKAIRHVDEANLKYHKYAFHSIRKYTDKITKEKFDEVYSGIDPTGRIWEQYND